MSDQKDYLHGARIRLEEMALRYARMATFGIYVENNIKSSVSPDDKKQFETTYLNSLKCAAIDLLQEMAMRELPPLKNDGET